MNDADNDGIWTATLPIAQSQIEYKFTLDGWNTTETLTQAVPVRILPGHSPIDYFKLQVIPSLMQFVGNLMMNVLLYIQ